MTRSAVTDGFVSQYPQPWAHAAPTKSGPLFFAGPNTTNIDSAATTENVAVIPDPNLEYVIDDIVLTFLTAYTYAAGVTTTSVAVGVLGYNKTGGAKDVANYFVTATNLTASKAAGTSLSISNGDLAWAATADTEAERTFRGACCIDTTCADVAGAPAGTFLLSVRCHVAGASNDAVYPEIVDEPAVI